MEKPQKSKNFPTQRKKKNWQVVGRDEKRKGTSMTTYEMRIDRLNFNTDINYDNIQAFSIGHESCILKFFKVIRNNELLKFIDKEKNLGKQIRIITPFIPERHLAEIKDVLAEINNIKCFHNSVIIVNDLGLMHYIHKMNENRQLCLGRNLLACFDYAPWGHRIYESEDLHIQKAVSQVSLYDDEKMDFFKKYNVTETEADVTKRTVKSLKEIQKSGFRVNIYKSSFTYGLQRSCYIKRYNIDQGCSGMECEYSEKLDLDELWCRAEFYKEQENINFPSPLYIRGNQIYGRAHDIPCDWADSIIISPEQNNTYKGADI